MRSSLLASIAFLSVGTAACGGGDSGTTVDAASGATADASSGDRTDAASHGADAGGGTAPAMIAISGNTSSNGLGGATPQQGITVSIFNAADDRMVATGTSDGSGNFTLSVATGGVPFDGYLKATKGTTYLPTYLYPAKPLTADFTQATVELLDSATLGEAAGIGGATQTAGDGFLGLQIQDASGASVGGAKATATLNGATAGTIEYDSGGIPSSSATSTAADGTVFVFSAKPGSVVVGATKTGATFRTHTVKVFKNSVTETIVEP